MSRTSLALALFLAATNFCHAQSEVEWKQITATPKGATLPRERADILGIELGDTYQEAKTKLQKLYDEGSQRKAAPLSEEQKRLNRFSGTSASEPITETKNVFRLQPPGSSFMMTASFVAALEMKRQLKGVSDRPIYETIKVFLSAPASGHQVIGINRFIEYIAEGDQPRVTEIVDQLVQKMKANPDIQMIGIQGFYAFQFNDGKPTASHDRLRCRAFHETNEASKVATINEPGDCDAYFQMKVTFGISRDHAKSIQFVLSDNDRTKANLATDFKFVQDYIRGLGERTRGAAPKL